MKYLFFIFIDIFLTLQNKQTRKKICGPLPKEKRNKNKILHF